MHPDKTRNPFLGDGRKYDVGFLEDENCTVGSWFLQLPLQSIDRSITEREIWWRVCKLQKEETIELAIEGVVLA